MENNIVKKTQLIDSLGYIPNGLGFPSELKIEDIRACSYMFYDYKYSEDDEYYKNYLISIKLKTSRMNQSIWINIFNGTNYDEESIRFIIATNKETILENGEIDDSYYGFYPTLCITEDSDNIEYIETIKEILCAFNCVFIDGDESELYTKNEPIFNDISKFNCTVEELEVMSFIKLNMKISKSNPNKEDLISVYNDLLSLANTHLYTVTVVHDFKIQFVKQFLTKEDAEKLFIEKCLYYYNEDGLEAFALTKNKDLKAFDAKDFEEYFQSEQWNDCCDIANVEINIM